MRVRTFSAVVVTLAMMLAGCGSSGSSSSSSSSSAAGSSGAGATSSSSSSSSSAAASSSSSSAAPSFANAGNCIQLAQMGAKIAQSVLPSGGHTVNFQALASGYQAMANAAPPAIQPQMRTIANAVGGFFSALQKAGYKPGSTTFSPTELAALAQAAKNINTPAVHTALAQIRAWAHANCHA